MVNKKLRIVLVSTFLAVLGVSVWWGGRNTWSLRQITSDNVPSAHQLDVIEKQFAGDTESSYSQYNLSVVYFRQQKYQEVITLLIRLLNSSDTEPELINKCHFNLGNALYKLAEQQQAITKAIELLKQSLIHYRHIIDTEKYAKNYTGYAVEKDMDAHFNYALVRMKLKLLNDMLQKQQKEKESERQLYQLLMDLREKEQEIADQLEHMKQDPYSTQTLEKREELMILRSRNLQQLKIIKEKLAQSSK